MHTLSLLLMHAFMMREVNRNLGWSSIYVFGTFSIFTFLSINTWSIVFLGMVYVFLNTLYNNYSGS